MLMFRYIYIDKNESRLELIWLDLYNKIKTVGCIFSPVSFV